MAVTRDPAPSPTVARRYCHVCGFVHGGPHGGCADNEPDTDEPDAEPVDVPETDDDGVVF